MADRNNDLLAHDADEDEDTEEITEEQETEGASGPLHVDRAVTAFLGGIVVGTAVGLAVGVLVAPAPGRTTRKRLGKRFDVLRGQAEDELDELRRLTRKRLARLR